MNVLIDNAGFINKGAELMLYSVMEQMLALYGKNTSFVVRRNIPENKKGEVYAYIDQKRQNLIPTKCIPAYLTKKVFGYVAPKDINLLLDAGGYWLGDAWVYKYTDNYKKSYLNYYSRLISYGVKMVMLPQAFGPFENEISRRFIKSIFPFFQLIFARDRSSYQHLTKAVGTHPNIKIAPDFTNIFNPEVSVIFEAKFSRFRNQICIIPNLKMLTHTNDSYANKYLDFLKNLVKEFLKLNSDFYFLIHEEQDDKQIVLELEKEFDQHFNIIEGLRADELKWLIGTSKTCITSRFHGLVSALSQGVPAFCTSWSHKYLELLNEYGFTEGLISLTNDIEADISKIINLCTNLQQERVYREKLEHISIIEKNKTFAMWEDIKLNLRR